MKKLQWQILVGVLAIVVIAVLLIGQNPSIKDVVNQPAAGGVYTEALVGSPVRFNPLLDRFNQVDRDVDRLIFSRLFVFDSMGNPQPDLVAEWGVSIGADVYNIVLRDDIYWHDGEPVTTADVEFTIQMIADPAIGMPSDIVELWANVDRVILDPTHMQFILPEAFAPFMDYLSFGILPNHLLANVSGAELIDHSFNIAPVGSGPYLFEDLVVDENGQITSLVLAANENYHQGRPNIDQIVFQYFPTVESALNAYEEGEVFGISHIDLGNLDRALNMESLSLFTSTIPQMSMVVFNLNSVDVPFFQEVELRIALMQALNRQHMINEIFSGQAVVANSPVYPYSWAYNPEVTAYQYDQETALQALRNLGYTIPSGGGNVRERDEHRLEFEFVYADTAENAQLAAMIREFWLAIGVQANLVPVAPSTLIRDYLEPREFQVALVDFSYADTPDPDPYPFWHQSQLAVGQNYSQWNDRRGSEYLERARVTRSMVERERLYRNFQFHFSSNLPALPLFFYTYTYAVDQEVAGIMVGPMYEPSDRFYGIVDWYLLSRPVVEDAPTLAP